MANPNLMLPGNKCGLSTSPIKDEASRADLIQFLK
jgi:hypothetical protein